MAQIHLVIAFCSIFFLSILIHITLLPIWVSLSYSLHLNISVNIRFFISTVPILKSNDKKLLKVLQRKAKFDSMLEFFL